MNNILLSICIPTYNRASYLIEALESISKQITPENKQFIEVCISDNASTDKTSEIIENYKKKSQISIVYHKNSDNKGADYNFLKVIEIANGKFCWFLGSDDVLEINAIDYILKQINKDDTINGFIVNRNDYDSSLSNKIKKTSEVALGKYPTNFLLNSDINYADFFDYIGYLSGQIIKRELWNNIITREDNLEQFFNSYIHVYIISKIFIQNKNFLWISEKLVGSRNDNDSFLLDNMEGLVKRMEIDIYGYSQISSICFDKNIHRKIIKKISTVPIKRHIIKINLSSLKLTRKLVIYYEIIKRYWSIPSFWYKSFIFMLIPKGILIQIQLFWQKKYKNL